MIAAAVVASSMVICAWAQTTNLCPTNLFLTDDGRDFWFNAAHHRTIAVAKIKEAQNSPESRPADHDPEGHWGKVTNGFQLSLRFEKEAFTSGEPITATVLMRNVSDETLRYIGGFGYWPTPVAILAFTNNKPLAVKQHRFRGSGRTETLYPHSQHKYRTPLNNIYDLSSAGDYVFRARYDCPKSHEPRRLTLTSQEVRITITGGPAAGH